MSDAIDIDALEALEKDATDGEWEVRYVLDEPRYGIAGVAVKQTSDERKLVPMSGSGGAMSFTEFVIQEKYTTDHSVANGVFIAALRNAAPALIAAYRERDALKAERDEARELLNANEDDHKTAVSDLTTFRAALEKAEMALKAYEAWEADLILTGDWKGEGVAMNQHQHDAMMEAQSLRNKALAAIKETKR